MNQKLKPYFEPAFLICVLVLGTAALSMPLVVKCVGGYLTKDPAPLRKPIQLLDVNGLAGYKIIDKQKIENHEVLESLGTQQYIQWIIEDTSVSLDSPVREFFLFITYYPKADRVPHVPEQCYIGGGYQLIGTSDVVLNIQRTEGTRKLGAKYLVFGATGGRNWKQSAKFPVVYFFRVSGDYASDRGEARLALQNIFKKYAYFCKIEIAFNQRRVVPDKEEAIKACERLLQVILPVMEKEYWPL